MDNLSQASESEEAAKRYIAMACEEAGHIPDVPPDTAEIPIATVGMIGAGTMGGGPMYYANSIGLGEVVARMQYYEQITKDPGWQPCKLLTDLANQGRKFS
jgi:3-hydroxyacyl-CoA dehydrogenase